MRVRPSLPILLLGSLLVAGCTAPSTPGDGSPDPSRANNDEGYGIAWRPGDYWVQRGYYEQTPDETVVTLDFYAEMEEVVDGMKTLRIVNSDRTHTHWVRVADGALIKESIGGSDRTYAPPCLGFAAAPEAHLEHACHRIGTRRPTGVAASDQPLSSRLNGTSNVSVPAGSFDTIQLETSAADQPLGREFYASRACFPARVVTADGDETIVLDLITFQCSKGASA